MRSNIGTAVTLLAAACCLALGACGMGRTVNAGGNAGGVYAATAANPASTLIWARKVQPGVTVTEIEDAFASVAAEDNIRPVGELPLSQELQLRSGEPGKFLKVYSYCDPAAARTMVDFNPGMAALLPCRISVVEQSDGLWIYTMNMDMLINMQGDLPAHVGDTVQRVRATIVKMLDRGARGEF